MLVKNVIKHFILVSKHKWIVFKLCCKIGLPIRGILHDLSKFSLTEFCESVKYYNGKKSPIIVCKEINGYSEAWLHHKGRNKHHSEYWVDLTTLNKTPIIPYKYAAEMICDRLSASITYNSKNWKQHMPLDYWNKEKHKLHMNEKIQDFVTEVLTQVKDFGINKTLTKKNIKNVYNKYCKNNKQQIKSNIK